MPEINLLDITQAGYAHRLAALRRPRYDYLLTLHALLLCEAGRTLMEIEAYLFCSRSSVYYTVRAYRTGLLGFTCDAAGHWHPPCAPPSCPLPEAVTAGVARSRATRL